MRSLFPSCCLLALGLTPALSLAALTNGKLQVGIVKDEAYLYDKQGKKEPLRTARIFQEGFRVETTPKNTVELILSNGSTLIVSPDTLLEVKTFRQVVSDRIVEGEYQKLDKEPSPSITEIEVIRGKVVGEVRKLNPQSSYTIKTPVGVARIRGTIYTVEFADNGKGTGTLNIGCVRGSVETTVFSSNAGPVTVEPGMQASSAVASAALIDILTKASAATPGAPQPAALSAATLAILSNPIQIMVYPIPAEDMAAIAALLGANSTLNVEVATTINAMAQTMPTRTQMFPNGAGGAPDKRYVKVITDSQVTDTVVKDKIGGPSGPTTTTTGGSSSLDETLKKITDNVDRTVEQKQINPSGT
mgnify:CR=1 FL=1